MEKYKIQLAIKAKNDFVGIIKYIRYNLLEPNIAKRYAKTIKEEIKKLEYMPQKFNITHSNIIKDDEIRKMVIKNYIVFYSIDENEKIVNVERILYGGTNWKNEL